MNYDVLIAGGGPAGLSTAFAAARAGAKVAVFEKSREIGYPIHTSGGSWIDEMQKLDIPARYYHPVYEGHLISLNRRAVFHYDKPVSCILDIRGLYQYLAEIASAAGAEIFIDSKVVQPILDREKLIGLQVRRHGRTRTFKAPLIVDASGVNMVVARKMGYSSGFSRVGVGAEYDLHAPHWPEERVALLFGSAVGPSGYGWVFPHGNHRVRVGVGLIRPDTLDDPRTYLENLLKSPLFASEFARLSRLEYHTGVIPSQRYCAVTVADNFLIVGDSGGLISTLLGEGIRFAIDIGRMAGQVAGEAVRKGCFDRRFLAKYNSLWQKKYKRSFDAGLAINKRLAGYSDLDWDTRVAQMAELSPTGVAALLKGDFNARSLTMLLKTSPDFVASALYSSLKTCFKSA